MRSLNPVQIRPQSETPEHGVPYRARPSLPPPGSVREPPRAHRGRKNGWPWSRGRLRSDTRCERRPAYVSSGDGPVAPGSVQRSRISRANAFRTSHTASLPHGLRLAPLLSSPRSHLQTTTRVSTADHSPACLLLLTVAVTNPSPFFPHTS